MLLSRFQRRTLVTNGLAELVKIFGRGSIQEKYYVARFAKEVLYDPEMGIETRNYISSMGDIAIPPILSLRDQLQEMTKVYKSNETSFLDDVLKGILQEKLLDDRLQARQLESSEISSPEFSQYIMDCEMNHKMRDLEEIKKRLMGNRMGFGIFHPAVGHFPLAMVYVALEKGMLGSIKNVLETASESKPDEPTHAIFYSISLCNMGGRGLLISRKLILQAMDLLLQSHSTINRFQTLSPIRYFRSWVEKNEITILPGQRRQACKEYLENCRKKTRNSGYDAVATFHYGNGAILEDVFEDATDDQTGAYGMMASYHYEPELLEQRAKEFSNFIKM